MKVLFFRTVKVLFFEDGESEGESFFGSGDNYGEDGGAWMRPPGSEQVRNCGFQIKVNWLKVMCIK